MTSVINKLDNYDLIIIGDVIEHISKNQGIKLLNKLRKKSKYLIIITPNYWETRHRKVTEDDYEKHLSFWTNVSFPDNPKIYIVNQINVIIYEQNKTSD